MNCKTTNKKAKLFYEQNIDNYQEARDEDFHICLMSFMDSFKKDEPVTEDDLQGFIDSYDFPDEEVWIASEYESALDDCVDAKYEHFKDNKL